MADVVEVSRMIKDVLLIKKGGEKKKEEDEDEECTFDLRKKKKKSKEAEQQQPQPRDHRHYGACSTLGCPGYCDRALSLQIRKLSETFDDDEVSLDDVPLLFSTSTSNHHHHHHRESSSCEDLDHCHMTVSLSRLADVRKAKRKLIIACFLCSIFVTGEIVGGIFANSLAILTDAAHMFSDFASFLVSLFAIWLGGRPAKKTYNFGFYRAEALGALFTVVIIWYVTGILLFLAGRRLSYMDFEVEPDYMMVVAAAAVVFNVILGVLFHGSHHHHNHNHSNNHHSKQINIRAAFIHVLGDLLQSIGVLISSIIIKLFPEYKAADPVCTIFFSFIVFCTTVTILKDTVHILMEGNPPEIKYDDIVEELLKFPEVLKVHDLRLWSLTTDRVALTCHVVVTANNSSSEQILQAIIKSLRTKYRNLENLTVQIENFKQVMNICDKCQTL